MTGALLGLGRIGRPGVSQGTGGFRQAQGTLEGSQGGCRRILVEVLGDSQSGLWTPSGRDWCHSRLLGDVSGG